MNIFNKLIALMLHERIHHAPPGPTLIFAPTSVVGNWVREIERFAPMLKVKINAGSFI